MLREETVIDKIEVLRAGHIQIRCATQIFRDDIPIGEPQYHRTTLAPGQDCSELRDMVPKAVADAELDRVAVIAKTFWTKPMIAAYQKQQAANFAKVSAQRTEPVDEETD